MTSQSHDSRPIHLRLGCRRCEFLWVERLSRETSTFRCPSCDHSFDLPHLEVIGEGSLDFSGRELDAFLKLLGFAGGITRGPHHYDEGLWRLTGSGGSPDEVEVYVRVFKADDTISYVGVGDFVGDEDFGVTVYPRTRARLVRSVLVSVGGLDGGVR